MGVGGGERECPGAHAAENRSRLRIFPLQRSPGGCTLQGIGNPRCCNSGHREQEDIYCELSLQKYSLKNHCRSRHCQGAPTAGGGVGRTPPRGRSLQRVEERERPCLGALPAGSGGGVGVVPGLLLHRRKGTPWQGGWSKKKEELGQGELTQSLWSPLWSPPAGGPVSVLLPAASHPRPLLPSYCCRFLWLRLTLSHELTAPNGLQLPCCSSFSSPLLDSERSAHSAYPRLSPPYPHPRSLLWPGLRNTGGFCLLAHTPWGRVFVWRAECPSLEWLP